MITVLAFEDAVSPSNAVAVDPVSLIILDWTTEAVIVELVKVAAVATSVLDCVSVQLPFMYSTNVLRVES
jgi:hypothetical protein